MTVSELEAHRQTDDCKEKGGKRSVTIPIVNHKTIAGRRRLIYDLKNYPERGRKSKALSMDYNR